jgi:hypothetical protein
MCAPQSVPIKDTAMKRNKGSLRSWIVVISVIVIGITLLASFSRNISSFVGQYIPAPYHKADTPLVEAAIAEVYGPDATIDEVRKHAYPVVIHLPSMSCVGFKLRPGWIGIEQSVCFLNSDGSVAVRHSR